MYRYTGLGRQRQKDSALAGNLICQVKQKSIKKFDL